MIKSEFESIDQPVGQRDRGTYDIPGNRLPRYSIVSDPEATQAIVSVMHRRKPVNPGTRSALYRWIGQVALHNYAESKTQRAHSGRRSAIYSWRWLRRGTRFCQI